MNQETIKGPLFSYAWDGNSTVSVVQNNNGRIVDTIDISSHGPENADRRSVFAALARNAFARNPLGRKQERMLGWADRSNAIVLNEHRNLQGSDILALVLAELVPFLLLVGMAGAIGFAPLAIVFSISSCLWVLRWFHPEFKSAMMAAAIAMNDYEAVLDTATREVKHRGRNMNGEFAPALCWNEPIANYRTIQVLKYAEGFSDSWVVRLKNYRSPFRSVLSHAMERNEVDHLLEQIRTMSDAPIIDRGDYLHLRFNTDNLPRDPETGEVTIAGRILGPESVRASDMLKMTAGIGQPIRAT